MRRFSGSRGSGRSDGPSVVLVRIEGLDSIQQADLIKRVWAVCAEALAIGAVTLRSCACRR
jgi:hypothetical protein